MQKKPHQDPSLQKNRVNLLELVVHTESLLPKKSYSFQEQGISDGSECFQIDQGVTQTPLESMCNHSKSSDIPCF